MALVGSREELTTDSNQGLHKTFKNAVKLGVLFMVLVLFVSTRDFKDELQLQSRLKETFSGIKFDGVQLLMQVCHHTVKQRKYKRR